MNNIKKNVNQIARNSTKSSNSENSKRSLKSSSVHVVIHELTVSNHQNFCNLKTDSIVYVWSFRASYTIIFDPAIVITNYYVLRYTEIIKTSTESTSVITGLSSLYSFFLLSFVVVVAILVNKRRP